MTGRMRGRKLCKWNAEKRRTVMPAELKARLIGEGLGDQLIVVKNLREKCLDVYSEAEWDRHVTNLSDVPELTPQEVWAIGYYVSGAATCDIDAQGRFVLPKDDQDQMLGEVGMCEYAGISDVEEVLMEGNVNHVRIWSKENWIAANSRNRAGIDAKTNDEAVSAYLGNRLDVAFK